MLVPLVLLCVSLAGVALALLSGQSGLLLLALSCAVASILLVVQALRRRGRLKKQPRWVIVDGSNVMHWKDGVVAISSVREVVDALKARGFTPGVVFDANAGYKIADRYLHHDAMARQLGLPEDQVMVVPKGTQADQVVLAAARDHKARVVSNDRFRDWAEAHPEVAAPGHLVRGGFTEGKLWLELD
jgi:hypothetical protein